MALKVADKIMNQIWGRGNWDINSEAHKYWKRRVKKQKRSLQWFRENAYQIMDWED